MQALPRNFELEAAAFADPSDHDAWRVYADWLQAQGDARGELVLLSILERDAFASERKAYKARLLARQTQMQAEWKSWAKSEGLGACEFGFSRGLLSKVAGGLALIGPRLDWLFEQAPIRSLTLRNCKPADVIELFARRPAWFQRLEYFKFEASPKLDGEAIAALASNPAHQLDGLNLTGCAIDGACCAALAKLDTRRLTRLVLTANQIDDDALAQLLLAEHRSQWRCLYLSANPITGAGIVRLTQTSGLEHLRELYAKEVEAEYADFAPLADPQVLPGLRVLEITTGWNAHRETRGALKARLGKGLRGA